MTFGKWAGIYLQLLFSRELWFSWYFLFLEGLVVYSVFEAEDKPWQAVKGALLLFGLAVFFCTVGFIMGYVQHRRTQRVKLETEDGRTHQPMEELKCLRNRLTPPATASS
jgi:hypothetical protein